MSSSAGEFKSRERAEVVITPPKPRSMQSRFILMESASVVVALVLIGAALGIRLFARTRLMSETTALQQRLSLHAQIFSAYDQMLLDFRRAFPPTQSSDSTVEYHKDAEGLRELLSRFSQSSATANESAEAARLEQNLESLLKLMDSQLAAPQLREQEVAGGQAVMARTEDMGRIFKDSAEQEFERLHRANRELDVYNGVLYALVVVLGLYPICIMVWLRRAQERNLWRPLEQLYRMVMEVKKGNLKVKGEIPDTVELGSLTAAFLSMAEELDEIKDSLEEKVRVRAAQLETANRDLLRAAKLASLGQLVSGVAHEINNPLTSILGFSEVVLSRPGLDPTLYGQLQTIHTEAIRLKHLVANLSTFSRRTPQNYSYIDLRTVPDRLIQLRAYQLAANNIRLTYERPEAPVWVNASSEQMLDVLLHLVLNAEQAIRSVRDKGEIRISCKLEGDQGIVTVEDDGCGMPEDIREHIFDPFFTTKPTGRGTGLGLSIAHTIVDQHGGQLLIESAAGARTTVHVFLPLVGRGEQTAGVSAPPRGGVGRDAGEETAPAVRVVSEQPEMVRALFHSQSGGGLTVETQPHEDSVHRAVKPSHTAEAARILAIDDESEILNLVSFVLGKTGATVVTLQDSTRLDSVLEGNEFDAVLCDLKMPGQDGLAVLRTLRVKRPELARRFLLMTGNLADADKALIELEGVPVLPKPFSIGSLRETVGHVLAGKG